MGEHDLTFEIARAAELMGVNAYCMTCHQYFRDAEAAEALDCRPQEEEA